MVRIDGRRAFMHLGTAGAFVLAAPALARDGRKKADETIAPPEDLMREHAILDRILLIYESSLRRLDQGEDIDTAVFVQSAGVVRDFIHDYHEKSEEELIFPRFRNAGRMVDLVNILAKQHGAGRRLTERILEVAPQVRTRGPRETMGSDIQAFAAMYRAHAAREETDLFPLLRELVTSDGYEELSYEMEKRERDAFGTSGFEKVVKKVAAIEAKIGIQDLDVFTPKN